MGYSDDDGTNWSPPMNLTKKLKDPTWYLLAPAPGCGIMMQDGTLAVPVQGRGNSQRCFSTIMTSKDHGESWILASSFARSGTNECAVAELSYGKLMLNMKNVDSRGARAVALTSELGSTWSVHPSVSLLAEPACMASLLRVERTNGWSALLLSNPANKTRRKHLTIKVSFDDGLTWPERYWLTRIDFVHARRYKYVDTNIRNSVLLMHCVIPQNHYSYTR